MLIFLVWKYLRHTSLRLFINFYFNRFMSNIWIGWYSECLFVLNIIFDVLLQTSCLMIAIIRNKAFLSNKQTNIWFNFIIYIFWKLRSIILYIIYNTFILYINFSKCLLFIQTNKKTFEFHIQDVHFLNVSILYFNNPIKI